MTRAYAYYLIVTALLAGHALAQDTVPQEAQPPAAPDLWTIAAAAVAVLAVTVIALKLRKPKQRLASPPEAKDTTPIQPKKQIENPITLKQKTDTD